MESLVIYHYNFFVTLQLINLINARLPQSDNANAGWVLDGSTPMQRWKDVVPGSGHWQCDPGSIYSTLLKDWPWPAMNGGQLMSELVRSVLNVFQLDLFLSKVNKRETIVAIVVNNDRYCLQKRIEKFPRITIYLLRLTSKMLCLKIDKILSQSLVNNPP